MPDPSVQFFNETLVEELLDLNPEFELSTTYINDFEGRIYEMNIEDSIQIILVPNGGVIHLPCWSSAQDMFDELRHYISAIQMVAHYNIYDPQVGAEINFREDFDLILSTYRYKVDLTMRGLAISRRLPRHLRKLRHQLEDIPF